MDTQGLEQEAARLIRDTLEELSRQMAGLDHHLDRIATALERSVEIEQAHAHEQEPTT